MKCCKPSHNSADKMKGLICTLMLALTLPCARGWAGKLELSSLIQPLETSDLMAEAGHAPDRVDCLELPQDEPQPLCITHQTAVEALLRAGQSAIPEEDTLEITIKSGWEPVTVAGTTDWELYVADRFAPDHRGRWSPMLILEVDGDVAKRWRLRCDVDLYRRVYMTTQRLGRGDSHASRYPGGGLQYLRGAGAPHPGHQQSAQL